MKPILNAFMLHGMKLNEIYNIAKNSDCGGISVEVNQLDDPFMDDIFAESPTFIVGAGALFLREDRQEESISVCRNILEKAARYSLQFINVVFQSGECEITAKNRCEFCRRLAQLGKSYGIRILVEVLQPSMKSVSSLVSFEETVALCKTVDSPWFLMTYDVCHCVDTDTTSQIFVDSIPCIGSVHLADLAGNDPDQREFPGHGNLPLLQIIELLRQNGYDGPVELEVISPAIKASAVQSQEALTQKIQQSFSYLGSCIVVGELACHRIVQSGAEENLLCQTGGNSGMIATQLLQLGVRPMIAEMCGDDSRGLKLAHDMAPWSFTSPIQEGKITSVVDIYPYAPEKLSIIPGTVDTTLLCKQLEKLPDLCLYGYMPAFPGYESALIEISRRHNLKMILDFGFFRWNGNYDILKERVIAAPQNAFCALLNGENMSDEQKDSLGRICREQGFKYAIITDGAQSVALYMSSGEKRQFQVCRVETPTDTCGAGDCFTAGVLHHLITGYSMPQAVEYGIQIAHKKIQTIGIWRK